MSKQGTKNAGRFDQAILPAAIMLLTAAYLLLTAGGVGLPVTATNTKITYDTAPITYGDVYFMSKDNFEDSYYGMTNGMTDTMFYTSTAPETGSPATFQRYDRYANITFNDHAAPSGTKMNDHTYAEFYKGYKEATVETGTGNATLPVLSTDGTGVYTVVPGSTGDYYVYVYSTNDPSSVVKYTLIDSAADANAYQGTSSGVLTFTNVTGNWWRAKVTVTDLGWQAISPTCTPSTVTQSSSQADSGTGAAVINPLTNSTLNNNKKYYYNIWAYSCVNYDTLLVLEWDSTAQLALVGKEGNITVNDGTNGTISVQTAFGEAVNGTAIHAPLYVTGTPTEDYVFAGLTGADGAAVETTLITDSMVSYAFMSDVTLTAAWEKAMALPTVQVELDGAEQAMLNFQTAKTGSTTFAGGTDAAYTFTLDFDGAVVNEVSYSVSGESEASGTLTANDPTCTVKSMWADTTVTFTATAEGRSYTITYTIKCVHTGSPVAMIQQTNETFNYLEDALVTANSADAARTVVVLRDASFYSGTPNKTWTTNGAGYTIGSNVTLLVPYAPGATTVDTTTGTDGISGKLIHANKTFVASNTNALDTEAGKYLTVTVPENITLNIANMGKFVIGGTIGSASGIAGATAGAHSNVILDGTLNIASGGILSCCGYILGTGTVNAASGAEMYQPFVVMDYRGGSFTYNSREDIAPFTRYTLQNIQATVNMVDGAMMYGYCDLYTGASEVLGNPIPAQHNLTTGLIVGGSTTGDAVLKLEKGATLTSTYDPDTYVGSYDKVGRTTLEISGGASLGVMQLNVSVVGANIPVDTESVMFPLPYNYDIRLNGSGSTYTMGYSFGILPGARVAVGEGATLNIGNSGTFDFMVFDGLYDHTSTGKEIAYGGKGSYPYPKTEELQATSFGGTGAGSLVVDGTLNILSGANFGGVVETGGTTGQVIMNSGANPKCTTFVGMVSAEYAGRTERTLTAEVVDTGTGLRTAMVAGMTYKAKEGSAILPSYTYWLYPTTTESDKKEYTETLNALVSGGWYNYTATIKMVDSEGKELSGYPAWFCANANVTALNLYSDAECTQSVTNIPANSADGVIYYSKTAEAEAVLNGESYFPTLLQAVKNATGKGDEVELLVPLMLSQSIPVDRNQNITVNLGGHSIRYTKTPFINDGKLTLNLQGAVISNQSDDTYTMAPAFTNNAGAEATVDLGGGSITVRAPAGNAAQLEGIVNYGTLTVQDTGSDTKGSINVYTSLGTEGKNYVLATKYGSEPYPTVTVNAELAAQNFTVMPLYVGIYNSGTLATLKDVTVHSPLIGVYNGAAAHIRYAMSNINAKAIPDEGEITATIGSIDGATVEGGWAGVLNAFGRIDAISGGSVIESTGRVLSTDAVAAYAALYNYLGEVGTISGSSLLSNNALTLARFRYPMETINGTLGDVSANTVTDTVYGIYNFGWIVADATKSAGYNLRTSCVEAINNSVIEGNGTPLKEKTFTTNEGKVTTFYGDAPNNANGYGIYNLGSRVGDIKGGSVTGNRAIYNQNLTYTVTVYGDNQTSSTYTEKTDTRIVPEKAVGTIGDIIDCEVFASYGSALMNYGMVGTIGGNTTVTLDARAANNYAIYNYGNWYGTAAEEVVITRREPYSDGSKYRTTVTEKWYQNYDAPAESFADVEAYWKSIDVPTIEAITGDVVITGINNTASNAYGRGLMNVGCIGEISGNVQFFAEQGDFQATPKNASYALLNSAGYIGSISGNVAATASYQYALSNESSRYGVNIETTEYEGETTTKKSTDTYREYATPAYIGSINGATFKTEISSYALNNNAWIKTIEDAEITSATTYGITQSNVPLSSSQSVTPANKQYHTWTEHTLETTGVSGGHFYHEENVRFGSRIGTIGGSTITAGTTYGIYNGGDIGAITDTTVYATKQNLYNGESNQAIYTVDRYNMGQIDEVTSGHFITLEERGYVFADQGAHIGTVENSTFAAEEGKTTNNTIYNLGTIDEISNVDVSAANTGLINAASGHYTERTAFRYLHGAAKFGTTSYIGETFVETERTGAHIGLIDQVSVDVTANNAFVNYGTVDTVQGSNFTAGTYNALLNGISGTYYSRYTDDYLTDIAVNAGKYAISKNCEEGYEAEDVSTIAMIVDSTFVANAVAKSNAAVNNGGIINEIDGANITATPASGVTADRAMINKGTIGKVKNTLIDTVNSYALENNGNLVPAKSTPYVEGIAQTAITADPVYANIAELGSGNEFTTGKQYAVYNAATASIGEISGGIYTSGGTYALYNKSTTDAILLSGGYYKGSTAKKRTEAVYGPDTATRYTYPEGMAVSKQGVTVVVTFADGTTGTDYYFIGPDNFVAKIVKKDTNGNEQIQGWYVTLQDAVEKYEGGTYYIQLQADSSETAVQVDRDVYLDLNGHTVSGTLAVGSGKTLYGLDKRSDGYKAENLGSVTVSGDVAAAADHPGYAGELYVAYTSSDPTATEKTYTFNRASIYVSDYYVEARRDDLKEREENEANHYGAVGFGATFRGNANAAAALTDIGFEIREGTNDPVEVWANERPKDLVDTYKVYYTFDVSDYEEFGAYGLMQFGTGTEAIVTKGGKEERTFNFTEVLKAYYATLDAEDPEDAKQIAILEEFAEKTKISLT